MLKIAVTGNIACGKSYIGQLLKDLGVPVIDCDNVVHKILSTKNYATEKLVEICKPTDITSGLESPFIDRKKLGQLVFSDSEIKKEVELLVHPKCFEKIDEFFLEQKNKGHKIAVNLIPLLFETNAQSRHDQVWLVYCNKSVQLERLKLRNPELTVPELQARIDSQMDQEMKKEQSDFIIDNSSTKEETKEQLKQILKQVKVL